MLDEQEKELFCFMHGITLNQYNAYEKASIDFAKKHPDMFPFCDSQRELSIWIEGLTEKMALNRVSDIEQASISLRQEVLEKLSTNAQPVLSETMENQLIRAYLLGRSGK